LINNNAQKIAPRGEYNISGAFFGEIAGVSLAPASGESVGEAVLDVVV